MRYWNYIVLIACTLLLLFLIWKELRRVNKSLLTARILATVIAVAGLACAALPLSYQQKQNRSAFKAAVLLTENFDPDSLQMLLRADTTIPVFTLEKQYASLNYQYISNAGFFTDPAQNYTVIHVLGNGLEEEEMVSIKNIPIVFHPTQIKKGITSISWNQQLKSGQPLTVQGHYKNDQSATAKITLNGFNSGFDSVLIPAGESKNFELSTAPRHLDKAVYAITVVSGKDTLENEPLPVEVIPADPIKILLLSSSPDFENKFMKNWFAQNSYQVVVRTRISTNKFSKDYLNISNMAVDRISTSVLNSFDILFADAAELSALIPSETAAIQSAINQQGMGLLVKVDSSIRSGTFYSNAFPLMQVKDKGVHPIHLQYIDDSTHQPSLLKINQPVYIRQEPGTQPLVTNERSQILISSKMQGLGKIMMTTLNNTYTWQLSGNEETYSSFWSFLLQKAAKKKVQEETFVVSPAIPVVNEKVIVQLRTLAPESPQVLTGAAIVNMEQNDKLPFLWQAYYWPLKPGWIPLMSRQKTISQIYIFDKKDWKNVRSENKKNTTLKFTVANSDHPIKSTSTAQRITTEVPKVYFFILFLLAASFLWFEKKWKRA